MPWRPLEQDVLWVLCPQLLALPGQVDDGRVVEDEPCRTTGLVGERKISFLPLVIFL